jgi:hypothetical protein
MLGARRCGLSRLMLVRVQDGELPEIAWFWHVRLGAHQLQPLTYLPSLYALGHPL